jgi:hypothetical protein
MACSHRRTYMTIALLVALLLTAAAAAACSAQATAGSSSPSPGASRTQEGSGADGQTPGGEASASGSGGAAKAASGADWTRIMKALGYMQAVAPTKPVVVLLGGSAARESTISDASWRDQIQASPNNGPATLAWNMGSRNRTMAQNVAIVKALPKGAQAIVFIGVNLGSFTSAQKSATIALPSPLPAKEPDLQQPHQYSTSTGILSTTRKKALVQDWLGDRYPVFKRNFGTSAGVLETLIKVCQTRGYKPVLFELPRDTAVIGTSLGAPSTRFRDKCKALATKYQIPWVSQVSAARLPNSSFYDLWHLVEPGRTTWQDLLSARTTALLKQYGFDGGGS